MTKNVDNTNKADKWTEFAAFGTGFVSAYSNIYFLSALFDTATGLPPKVFRRSIYGLCFAIFISFFTTMGTIYSRRELNKSHQPQQNILIKDDENAGEDIEEKKLTPIQRFALLGDFTSHVFEKAGPITALVNLATADGLSRWYSLILQLGAMTFGGLVSVANVYSAKDAMLNKEQTKNHHHHHHYSDGYPKIWINFATVGEAIESFATDSFFYALFFDLATGLKPNIFELSYYAIVFGGLFAFFSSCGAAYSHRSLNQFHQHNTHNEKVYEILDTDEINDVQVKLSWKQKIAVAGDLLSHAADSAGPVTLITDEFTKNSLPRWGKLLVQCGATMIGSFLSVADARSCKDSMEKNAMNCHKPAVP